MTWKQIAIIKIISFTNEHNNIMNICGLNYCNYSNLFP